MLGIAAKYADGVNIGGFPGVAEYKERLDDLQSICRSQGRDFGSIRKSHFIGIATADDQAALDRLLGGMARERGISVEEMRERYRGFIGTPEAVADFLQQYIDLGVDQFMLVFPYGNEEASVRLISERTLPRVQ